MASGSGAAAALLLRSRHTDSRHPEEPRACAASRRIATGVCGHPSRLAEGGEHLRMTAEFFAKALARWQGRRGETNAGHFIRQFGGVFSLADGVAEEQFLPR